MVSTDADAQTGSGGRSFPRLVGLLALGVLVGLSGYYLIAVAATAQIPGSFTIHPLALSAVALIAALGVFVGWRWPVVGLTGGILIIVLVSFAVSGRMDWSSAGAAWLDPFNAVAFGAASAYPMTLGAVTISGSVLRLRSRPRR